MSIPAILDVEASGFGRGSYPIEVGFVDAAGELFCSLIQPEPEWLHWDPSAENLHGISRAVLVKHGKPPGWVAQQLNERLQGQVVYCDAWGHDYPWLARLFDAGGCQQRFKLADLRSELSDAEQAAWQTALEQVRGECALTRHRASTDALILQRTLKRLRQETDACMAGPPIQLPIQQTRMA